MSRTKDTENFPVGSFLVAKPLRPVIHAYYRFARAADDISDDPALAPDEKVRRLDAIDGELTGAADGGGPASRIRDILSTTPVPIAHCRDLLVAFKRDSVRPRTKDWADLMDYCRYSANPVGRFLLDLHGESHDTWAASDALCSALQVINHLQDCKDDYRALDRVYLPADWLAEEGIAADEIDRPAASPALARVLARMVAATRPLVAAARDLPGGVVNKGMRRESAVIVAIAERLLDKLDGRDPLAQRIELTKWEVIKAALGGLWRGGW